MNERIFKPYNLWLEQDRIILRGKWVKSKEEAKGCLKLMEAQITSFMKLEDFGWVAVLSSCYPSSHNFIFNGEELFENFIFDNGSPVGKLDEATKETKHILTDEQEMFIHPQVQALLDSVQNRMNSGFMSPEQRNECDSYIEGISDVLDILYSGKEVEE